jgi:hypothetical protein
MGLILGVGRGVSSLGMAYWVCLTSVVDRGVLQLGVWECPNCGCRRAACSS